MPKPFTGALVLASLATLTISLLPASHDDATTSPSATTRAAITTGTSEANVTNAVVRHDWAAQTSTTATRTATGKRLRVFFPRRASAASRITVRGTLPAVRWGRPVVLSRKNSGSFQRVAFSRADKQGRFRFAVTAPRTAGRSTWRVEARGFGAQVPQTVTFRIAITGRQSGNPTLTSPEGSPTDWTYIRAGKSMRWDPCSAIDWHYAPERQAYSGAERDVTRAIAMLAAQSGQRFTRVSDKSAAALTIRWATPAQEPLLEGSTVGVGGPSYTSIDPARNGGTEAEIVGGAVTFDATANARPGFNDTAGWTWGQVFLHEVMHAMGLGHARGPVQVMYPMASTRNQHLAAGDLGGLAAVGAQKGCIDNDYSRLTGRVRTALMAE